MSFGVRINESGTHIIWCKDQWGNQNGGSRTFDRRRI